MIKRSKVQLIDFFKPEVLKKETNLADHQAQDSERNMIKIVASVEVRPKQSLRVKADEPGTSKNSVYIMLKKLKIRTFKSK